MVSAIAKKVKEQIQSEIRHQFFIGRSKESSFPTRLIESLKTKKTPDRESVMESIRAVQAYEARFGRLGLVPDSATTKQLNYHADTTENAGMLVLKTYLDDIREKFSLADEQKEIPGQKGEEKDGEIFAEGDFCKPRRKKRCSFLPAQ